MSEIRDLGTGTGSVSILFTGAVSMTGTYDNNTITMPSLRNANARGERTVISIGAGETSVAVPAGAAGVFIVLPSTNTVVPQLRTSAGVAGLPLHPKGVAFIPLSTGEGAATTILLQAATAITGVTLLWM